MRTEFSRQRSNLISNYGRNALIQLIVACGVCFILAYAMFVIFLVIAPDQKMLVNGVQQTVSFHNSISAYIGIQSFSEFLHKPWVLLTYPWAHQNFLQLLSNMLWLYCFGSVIQSLVGYREIIPLFIIASLVSAVLFLAATALWPPFSLSYYYNGALPGIMAFAIGAITLAPRFRFYLGERFAIPLWLVLAVFLLINTLNFAGSHYGMLLLCAAAALTGFGYIKLLQSGVRPGQRVYAALKGLQGSFTPNTMQASGGQQRRTQALHTRKPEPEQVTDERIDMLLDKINQKGYDSLTAEEKETLLKASKGR